MLRKIFKRRKNTIDYSEKMKELMTAECDEHQSIENLYQLFDIYEKMKQIESFFEKKIIHYIAEKAYRLDLRDEAFIFKVLSKFLHLYFHFGHVLCPLSSNHFSASMDLQHSLRFSEFFLRHANKQRITVRGRRIFDLPMTFGPYSCHPCEVAIRLGLPESLQVLLRHGAFTDANHRAKYYTNILRAVAYIIRSILAMRWQGPWLIAPENNSQYDSIVSCGVLMARVCPQLQKCFFFSEMSLKFIGFASPEQAMKWVAFNDLPGLESQIFLPMTLKQACKVKIRKVLKDRWELPLGIQKLPISQYMKDYLDLLSD